MSRSRYMRGLLAGSAADVDPLRSSARAAEAQDDAAPSVRPRHDDLFVWFEDNRQRRIGDGRGAAGFPECLLPYGSGIRVLERRYAAGHVHLLAAVRIRCAERHSETVARIYTAALALGTIAWIGTGEQYRRAWTQMYPRADRSARARPAEPAG
jgi:hypothetical protein